MQDHEQKPCQPEGDLAGENDGQQFHQPGAPVHGPARRAGQNDGMGCAEMDVPSSTVRVPQGIGRVGTEQQPHLYLRIHFDHSV